MPHGTRPITQTHAGVKQEKTLPGTTHTKEWRAKQTLCSFVQGLSVFSRGSSQEKRERDERGKKRRGKGAVCWTPKGISMEVHPGPNSGPPFSHSVGQSGFSLNHVFSLESELPFPVFIQKAPRPEDPIQRSSPRSAVNRPPEHSVQFHNRRWGDSTLAFTPLRWCSHSGPGEVGMPTEGWKKAVEEIWPEFVT